jgi:hypothetical protein
VLYKTVLAIEKESMSRDILILCITRQKQYFLFSPVIFRILFISSRQGEHSFHELVIVDLDPAIPISVNPLERISELLDGDTSPHETIEGYSRGSKTTD